LPDGLPAELLLLTDAEANFADSSGIAAMLRQHRIRLDVLVIGDASANGPLAQIAQQTGGQQARQIDPAAWAAETKQMLRAASPNRMLRESIAVSFQNELAALPGRSISSANRTWLKDSATELATGKSSSETFPLAARWRVGDGEVIAMVFSPTSTEIETIANLMARRPRDPRFSVRWKSVPKLNVRIEAQDHGQQMNGVSLSIQIGQTPAVQMPQTAPGRYEIDLRSPRSPQIATIRHEGEVVDRFAIAGKYPAEFDAVGNDVATLEELADRTGGRMIEPSDHGEIQFNQKRMFQSIASLMAAIGSVCIGLSLVWWRRWG
jgi:hypothetical protein